MAVYTKPWLATILAISSGVAVWALIWLIINGPYTGLVLAAEVATLLILFIYFRGILHALAHVAICRFYKFKADLISIRQGVNASTNYSATEKSNLLALSEVSAAGLIVDNIILFVLLVYLHASLPAHLQTSYIAASHLFLALFGPIVLTLASIAIAAKGKDANMYGLAKSILKIKVDSKVGDKNYWLMQHVMNQMDLRSLPSERGDDKTTVIFVNNDTKISYTGAVMTFDDMMDYLRRLHTSSEFD